MILLCSSRPPRHHLRVTWNGLPVTEETVLTCGSHRVTAKLPAEIVGQAENTLALHVEDTGSGPAPAREAGQPSAGVTRIRFVPLAP
jgi:hypothetical protein